MYVHVVPTYDTVAEKASVDVHRSVCTLVSEGTCVCTACIYTHISMCTSVCVTVDGMQSVCLCTPVCPHTCVAVCVSVAGVGLYACVLCTCGCASPQVL